MSMHRAKLWDVSFSVAGLGGVLGLGITEEG